VISQPRSFRLHQVVVKFHCASAGWPFEQAGRRALRAVPSTVESGTRREIDFSGGKFSDGLSVRSSAMGSSLKGGSVVSGDGKPPVASLNFWSSSHGGGGGPDAGDFLLGNQPAGASDPGSPGRGLGRREFPMGFRSRTRRAGLISYLQCSPRACSARPAYCCNQSPIPCSPPNKISTSL